MLERSFYRRLQCKYTLFISLTFPCFTPFKFFILHSFFFITFFLFCCVFSLLLNDLCALFEDIITIYLIILLSFPTPQSVFLNHHEFFFFLFYYHFISIAIINSNTVFTFVFLQTYTPNLSFSFPPSFFPPCFSSPYDPLSSEICGKPQQG